MAAWGGPGDSGSPHADSWGATLLVRLSGARAAPDAFVLGAALRASATVPRRVGVAVSWFGPRSWRLDVTPEPPDAAERSDPEVATDAVDDDYRAAATVHVDFDEDEQGRRLVRLAAVPMAEPFRPPRDAKSDREPASAELTTLRQRRSAAGAAEATAIAHTLAVGFNAVSTPTTGGEDAATTNGLARPAPQPDPMWQAATSHVTTLRTLLTPDEIVACLRDVPFARRSRPGRTPVIFVVGETGHAAGQVVTLTVAGDDAPGSTVLLSYLVDGSGDPIVDAVVSARARACTETVCAAVVAADTFAVRDDSPSDGAS